MIHSLIYNNKKMRYKVVLDTSQIISIIFDVTCLFMLSVFWIPGISVHLLLGPFNDPASTQGRNDDRSPTEKTLMRRHLMRRTTAKLLRNRRPPHELFLVRGGTTSTSARHVPVLSKKIRAEDCVPTTLPPTGRRPAFVGLA
jgi:hypothetical protein